MNYSAIARQIKDHLSDGTSWRECALPERTVNIGLPGRMDTGTVFCCSGNCDERCAEPETPERIEQFECYIAWLEERNIWATEEARRIARKRTPATEQMQVQRIG